MVQKADSKNKPSAYCTRLVSVAVISFLLGNNFNGWNYLNQVRSAASSSSSSFQSVVDSFTNTAEATTSDTTKSAMIVNGYKSMGANSGDVFMGDPYRTFVGERRFHGWTDKDVHKKVKAKSLFEQLSSRHHTQTTCSKWSVVTTIFEPSDAIIRTAQLGDDWCLVVVGDNKTPDNYLNSADGGVLEQPNVFFLSMEEQKLWANEKGTSLGDLVALTPENHFGRKNIGFLYAILRGAKFIFDFDDDNFVNKDGDGKLVTLIPNEEQVDNVRFVFTSKTVFNHHPLMETSIPDSWARGFPLGSIQDEESKGKAVSKGALPMSNVAVIQFCADDNPDVDAVHRFVKPLPMFFSHDVDPVLVPSNAYSPYNAQATLHTQAAMFATLLPVTVKGRVSDIWRSYFSQAIFKSLELGIVFAPPKITQIRNAHNYYGDMESEKDLYFKAEKLVEFLTEWSSSAVTTAEKMEELWIALYERGYIEIKDVQMVQYWLAVLSESEYEFQTKASGKLPTPESGTLTAVGKMDAPTNTPEQHRNLKSDTENDAQTENAVQVASTAAAKSVGSSGPTVAPTSYLCLHGVFADNCNRILSLVRAKRLAEQLGLELAFTVKHAKNAEMLEWYDSWFDPSPHVKIVKDGEMIHCQRNITGKQAYYFDFSNGRASNPFLPQAAKYFLPRKDLRERAEKAFKDSYGDKKILSVHRRNHRRCSFRATDGKYGRNVGGGNNCTKSIMLQMCDLTFDTVQKKFNPNGLDVVLFTDGRNATLDSTFPVVDDQGFFEQIWMMTQSEEHVGIPVSTVDLVVNHWRYAMGKSTIHPAQCYNEFKEEYVLDPSHFDL